MAKQKAKKPKRAEKAKRHDDYKAPKTAQDWRDLEVLYVTEQAKWRLAGDITDAEGGREIEGPIGDRLLEMEHIICTTPAVDLPSLQFKLNTYEPDMWDSEKRYPALRDDVLRHIKRLERKIRQLERELRRRDDPEFDARLATFGEKRESFGAASSRAA